MVTEQPTAGLQRPATRRLLLVAAVIFVVGVVMGLPGLAGEFLSGDDVHLVLNHVLVNHPTLSHALQLVTIIHRDLYQPVPMLSFSLDFLIIRTLGLTAETTGPDAGGWVFHLTNIIIHAVNAVLVFWLFSRLQRRQAVALCAALLFALHPYAAEVVVWLNGRMMLLATTFSLASLIAMDRLLQRDDRRGWVLGVLAQVMVVLAMASKIRVGLPVLMLILPAARRRWPDRRWWVAWACASVLTMGFTALNIATTAKSEMFQNAAAELHGSRIARTMLVLAWYLQHYTVPAGLSPWHPPESLVEWSHPDMPLAMVTLAAAGAAVAISWRRTRIGVLGALWFLATLASTLPLIPSRGVMVAERYVYLPNIGLHWIVGGALVGLVVWLAKSTNRKAVGWLAAGLGVVLAAMLMRYTWQVERFFTSNVNRATRIAEVYPDEPGVWEDIGWALYRRGDYAEAIRTARIDLEKHPQKSACEVLQLIGMAQVRLGRLEQGLGTLQQAIEADPKYGKCYSRLGQIYYENGRYAEAEENLRQALEIMPNYLPSVQVLGHLYRVTGRLDEAAAVYRRGLEMNDFDPVCTTAFAEIEMGQGLTAEATARFEQLLSWMPENVVARTNLGVCYAGLGRSAEAIEAYERALEYEPGATTAAVNLALLKMERGDHAGALVVIERARGFHPADRDLLVAAHDLFQALNRLQTAAAMWTQALAKEQSAPDLLAWYAWTSALAGQWAPARMAAQRALATDTEQAMAIAALILAETAAGDAHAFSALLDRLLAMPDGARPARARLRDAIAVTLQRRPDDPWPYLVAGRLLLADEETDAARLMIEEFIRRCRDPQWQARSRALLKADP
ncbi:MAG: tetratricopeptide repeat protein [bacterium]|nr:tetratricopeptide repeat protein [bacterium]